MFGFLDYYSLSLFLGGVIAICSGAFVFFENSIKKENRAWMLLNIGTAIWSFGYFSMIISNEKYLALLSNWILHIGAILIPVLYFNFIICLTKNSKKYQPILLLLAILSIFFLLISKSTSFVQDVFPKGPLNFAPDAGYLYIYFTLYFFASVIIAEIILIRSIFVSTDDERVRLLYVLFSSAAGFLGGSSVFLLTFNIHIPPYPLIFFSLYPIIITYAIVRHKLFNIKVISTEILTFGLLILLLFRSILASTVEEQVTNISILVIAIILGIFIIRSVRNEIEAREEIERLAKDLAKANERLKELDKLKSEFVSIASHQLRSPLTAIKGYASLVLGGSFGKITPGVQQAIDKIFQSSQSLVMMVEDFLNVSRIEQGRMKFELAKVNFKKLVEEIIGELKPSVEKAGLSISFSTDHRDPYFVNADTGKMRQVIVNLIDNSIKYTPRGSISVTLSKKPEQGKILFAVSDTGVGVDASTIPILFSKFSRSKDANKVNVVGTGLGLYVAKEIVAGHGGKVWVESGGKGRGATFFVELAEDVLSLHRAKVSDFAKTL